MSKTVLELDKLIDNTAKVVGDAWEQFNQDRQVWLERGLEARRYVSAETTDDTDVGLLPWKNKTRIPKLTQIADNLHSYYMAATMPEEDWFIWEGSNPDSRLKASVIEQYMRAKLKSSGFEEALSKIIWDWVVYGNCFGGVTWVEESTKDILGQTVYTYIGPKLYRISPIDCAINPRAKSFTRSPFMKRDLVHIANLQPGSEEASNLDEEALAKVKELRNGVYRDSITERYKEEGIGIDGFNTFNDYLDSGFVELLEFWGDLYVPETGEILKNQVIIVADRGTVLMKKDNPSWTGMKPFAHVGWRTLTDNLYGQGPLDQLIGMQYRCDHLENLKADSFDQIVHPMVKVKGDTVEDFEFGPGEKVFVGADGDVEFLRPDTTVLQADNQIAFYHSMMEQMAGSPREMMGFRTPGEKTAFEVQVLQQGADRLFMDRVNMLETSFIQPVLNLMFELVLRNLNVEDTIRIFNDADKSETFLSVTREDLAATGTLRPLGSRHYAARNKRISEFANMLQVIGNMPSMLNHFSGLRAGEMLEEELGFDKFNLFEENIGIKEAIQSQMETALQQRMAQQVLQGENTDELPNTIPPEEGA